MMRCAGSASRLWTTVDDYRAIVDRTYRAIKNPIIVLSKTETRPIAL